MTITTGGLWYECHWTNLTINDYPHKEVSRKELWNGAMYNTVNSLFTTNPLLRPLRHYEHIIWQVPTGFLYALM